MPTTPSASARAINTPTAFASNNERLAAADRQDRPRRRVYVLFMVIAAETDEEADGQVEPTTTASISRRCRWLAEQGAADKTTGTDTTSASSPTPEAAVNLNMGTWSAPTKAWPDARRDGDVPDLAACC